MMGRKSSKPGAIPRFRPRKRGKVTYYYYDHGITGGKRSEESLGTDYGLAIKKWAELERASVLPPAAVVTFRHVAEAYFREVVPTKAPRTQKDNAKELKNLLAFFDDPPCPFESIVPGDVKDYLKWRKAAPVRAQREKALLSHIWNWAAGERYTDKPNPCAGIKTKGSKGRDAYVESDQYKAIWLAGSPMLRDAMDLAYLTGQRPADVLAWTEEDVREGVLHVRQGKTAAKVRVEVLGALEDVLERASVRRAGFRTACSRLVVNTYGKPVDGFTLRRHWRAACAKAGVVGLQFRDLRAKAATDTEEATGNVRDAQRQLGHKSVRMTEHYVRNRRGTKVMPTGELRKTSRIAEKKDAPESASNMEAEVGIEPAYADLQSDPDVKQ